MFGKAIFELRKIHYGVAMQFGIEAGGSAMNGTGFSGQAGVGPCTETPVEDVDVSGTKGARSEEHTSELQSQ